MSLFSPRFRNKVLQMTYRPRKGKTTFSPMKSLESFEKAIDDSLESLFTEKTDEKDKDEKDKDGKDKDGKDKDNKDKDNKDKDSKGKDEKK